MQQIVQSSYSVDMMKKYAFVDELNNCLRILPAEKKHGEVAIIIQYLEDKIKEIDKRHK